MMASNRMRHSLQLTHFNPFSPSLSVWLLPFGCFPHSSDGRISLFSVRIQFKINWQNYTVLLLICRNVKKKEKKKIDET